MPRIPGAGMPVSMGMPWPRAKRRAWKGPGAAVVQQVGERQHVVLPLVEHRKDLLQGSPKVFVVCPDFPGLNREKLTK